MVGAKQVTPRQEPRQIIVIGQQYSADGSSRQVQQTIQPEGRSLAGRRRSGGGGRRRGLAVIGSTRKKRFENLLKLLKQRE